MKHETHGICRFHLQLLSNQQRWWSAIRQIHYKNKYVAKNHLEKCKNVESDVCNCDKL